MTIKTLSAVAVRVIGWLVVLEGIKSFLLLVFAPLLRTAIAAALEPSRPMTTTSYVPIVIGAVVGFIELGAGFMIILNSEYFGRLLSKGLDERL